MIVNDCDNSVKSPKSIRMAKWRPSTCRAFLLSATNKGIFNVWMISNLGMIIKIDCLQL